MKSSNPILLALIAALALLGVGVFVGAIYVTALGLYLAFKASVILGVVALFIEPMPAVIGLVKIFAHQNLAQMILDFCQHLPVFFEHLAAIAGAAK